MKIFSILFFLSLSFSICAAQIKQTADSTSKKNTNLGGKNSSQSKSQSLYGSGGSGSPTGVGMGAGPGVGSGSGASLDMAGWRWNKMPVFKDNTDETGRVRFKVTINADGDIESIVAVEKSLSPSLVRNYESQLRELTFSRSNGKVATEGAVGYITIIIKKY